MGYISSKWFLYYYSGLSQAYYSGIGFFITIPGLECGLMLQPINQELIKLAGPYSFPTFTFTTTPTTTITTNIITTMSSAPASLAIVIYTTNDTTATTLHAKGEGEGESEGER